MLSNQLVMLCVDDELLSLYLLCGFILVSKSIWHDFAYVYRLITTPNDCLSLTHADGPNVYVKFVIKFAFCHDCCFERCKII